MSHQADPEEERISARWETFLQHIAIEAGDQGRDAHAFLQPDRHARTVRARLFADPTGETSFAVTLSVAQLLEGDLRDLARRFLAAYIAAFDDSWPPLTR